MLTNLTKLEVKVGEKVYHFLCDVDAPLNDVKVALFQLTKYVGQAEDAIMAKIAEQEAAQKDAEKSASEEPKPE